MKKELEELALFMEVCNNRKLETEIEDMIKHKYEISNVEVNINGAILSITLPDNPDMLEEIAAEVKKMISNPITPRPIGL